MPADVRSKRKQYDVRSKRSSILTSAAEQRSRSEDYQKEACVIRVRDDIVRAQRNYGIIDSSLEAPTKSFTREERKTSPRYV